MILKVSPSSGDLEIDYILDFDFSYFVETFGKVKVVITQEYNTRVFNFSALGICKGDDFLAIVPIQMF